MKKTIIGALVGGLLIFIWQFFSWGLLNLHRSSQQYTPNQDSILHYLGSQLPGTGQYFLPTFPEGASMEQQEQQMKAAAGKPWAVIAYHQTMQTNMVSNMLRGFAANVVMVGLLCWVLLQFGAPSFGKIGLTALFTGLIAFTNEPYTMHIWYETPGIGIDLADALIGWGLCGLWLGYWMKKKPAAQPVAG